MTPIERNFLAPAGSVTLLIFLVIRQDIVKSRGSQIPGERKISAHVGGC